MWVLRACSSADSAVRRLRHVQNVISKARCSSSAASGSTEPGTASVSIGNTSVPLVAPNQPELVPTQHLPVTPGQSVLTHLRWIMQKDALGQDVFLIGPPGSLRRHLAMQYCELTEREVEYVSLSRDTTESDLKQRREIQDGTAFYVDQAAVRAALEGRVLILDGIEKAERNVLPVLNNLLENREMQLDDGCFLIPAARYDSLVKSASQAELDSWKLKRVSDRFRVIALGLPVPRYKGNPLDPPLRSRFQGRDINHVSYADALGMMTQLAPKAPEKTLSTLLSVAGTLCSAESHSLSLPDFPLDSIGHLASILNCAPDLPITVLLQCLYPSSTMLSPDGVRAYGACLTHFHLSDTNLEHQPYTFSGVTVTAENGVQTATVSLAGGSEQSTFKTPAGSAAERTTDSSKPSFVSTTYHEQFLAMLMLSHSVGDVCIVGPKGCGKSALACHFADLLHYNHETVLLYQDMTARDLLQQRMTLPNGDTAWRPSPLVTAAINGNLAILDGLHRINAGTLAVLQRLLQDRELTLYDGTRLLRQDRYELLKQQLACSDEEMSNRGVRPIHPSFRILALAEPPVLKGTKPPWLNPESLTMFLFQYMRPMKSSEEVQVLKEIVPGCDSDQLEQLMGLTQTLRSAEAESTLLSLSSSLSTRQLLRIARRMESFGEENVYLAVQKACLSRFLPQTAQGTLTDALEVEGIFRPSEEARVELTRPWEKKDGRLRIGHTTVDLLPNKSQVKVPNVLFYDNPQHTQNMEEMLKDFALGEHLLLVGNQGVGKNKLVDRFLYLLDRPREYIQLHRDTTVQTLTLQPTVRDGCIVYEDSPLVVALQRGHVLVVDEADKAPTHVTCILKALVESGEMLLGDGRRVITGGASVPKDLENVIVAHPDFRLIVLANRPGFPFLGNDFFASLGDMFSCHAIDNPDRKSELVMLRQYGPAVPQDILEKLVSAFAELRGLADGGLISYPYSTREVVNIVKHLQKFHDEGLPMVVRNVFDFDFYQPELQRQIIAILQKHGIPLAADRNDVRLSKRFPLPTPTFLGRLQRAVTTTDCRWSDEQLLHIQGPADIHREEIQLDVSDGRTNHFSERFSHFRLPLEGSPSHLSISSVEKGASDAVYVVTTKPHELYSFQAHADTAERFRLSNILPTMSFRQELRMTVVALQNKLSGQVLIHDSLMNFLLLVDTTHETARSVRFRPVDEETVRIASLFSGGRSRQASAEPSYICADLVSQNKVVIYTAGKSDIYMLDMLEGGRQSIEMPFRIKSLVITDPSMWIITDEDGGLHMLTGPQGQLPSTLACVDSGVSSGGASLSRVLPPISPSSPVNLVTDHHGRVNQLTNLAASATDARAVVEVHSCLPVVGSTEAVWLADSSQLVQVVDSVPDAVTSADSAGSAAAAATEAARGQFLRVIDTPGKAVRYMPMTEGKAKNQKRGRSGAPYGLRQGATASPVLTGLSSGNLMTVENDGTVSIWQLRHDDIVQRLSEWQRMVGGAQGQLQINYSGLDGLVRGKGPGKGEGKGEGKDGSKMGKDGKGAFGDFQQPTRPKHGKIDPTNAPHVGGNTWAGGTGGRDTAGLGGVGGPYRLDSGNPIHQVPDEIKKAVPREVTEAARAMSSWKQKMKEIEMGEFDAKQYTRLSEQIAPQVQTLRVILEALEAKQKDRSWTRHQTSGELDDNKLIEGLAGEKDIYRRRTDQNPDDHNQEKPKRLRLVVDASGSMYYFNGMDGRLDRELLSVLMVMQAFDKHQEKFKLDIVGHSGEGETPILSVKNRPLTDRERLMVLTKISVHTQMATRGDSTVEVTENAVKEIAKEEADEHFVIVLSDANFDDASDIGRIMVKERKVNTFVIFIGSLGDQADRLKSQLPSGRCFICQDTNDLPKLLQRILTSSILH